MRTGIGTIKSFNGDPSFTVLGIERGGTVVHLTVAPSLVERLVRSFGVQTEKDFTAMDALINLRARWVEDRTGVLVDLEPLWN